MKRRSGFGNKFLDPLSGIGEYDESSGVAGFVAARDPPQKLAHRGASRRPRAEEDCLPVGYGPVILRANHVERESRELPEEAFRRFDGRRAGDYLLFPGERPESADEIGHVGAENAVVDMSFIEDDHSRVAEKGAGFRLARSGKKPGMEHVGGHEEDSRLLKAIPPLPHRNASVDDLDVDPRAVDGGTPFYRLVVQKRPHRIQGDDRRLTVSEEHRRRKRREDQRLSRRRSGRDAHVPAVEPGFYRRALMRIQSAGVFPRQSIPHERVKRGNRSKRGGFRRKPSLIDDRNPSLFKRCSDELIHRHS